MFGKNFDMNGMMEKMQEMQQAVEESKKRLENIYVKGESTDGKIRFVMDGNRVVKDVKIDELLLNSESKEELEDQLAVAFNRALEDANHVNESEMKNTASGMLPGMGI